MEKNQILDSIRMACDWITDIAQLKTDEFSKNTINRQKLAHKTWKGAIRGEYSVAEKTWWFFCPVWHTGQAVKSLVMASEFLEDEKYIQAAQLGADFIFANQVWDKSSPDHGLILAHEDLPDKVNTSAIIECMHGLMLLANKTNSDEMWDRIIAAGYFIIDNLFMPEYGLFRDGYDPQQHKIVLPNPFRTKDNIGGRPLLDDAIFMRLFEKNGDKRFFDVHMKISERLLADQNPVGHWIDYDPCNNTIGMLHPRQTYWWSMPLLFSYRATGRKEFLDTVIESAKFCEKAMRADGGWIRGLYLDYKTDSFNHATSGSACAALLWMELFKETQNRHWLKLAEKAIAFCKRMQFTDPEDKNLKGAVLEKVTAPNGTDRNPYFIRDLGTIFYIQAGVEYLQVINKT